MESNLIRILFGRLLDALRIKDDASRRERSPLAGELKTDSLTVVTDGITIRGRFFFPSKRPDRQYPALIICHGVPGSGKDRPSDDPGYEALADHFARLGLASVVFNFRGCGDSGGNFDIMGWTRDLEAVLDQTLNTPYIDPTRVMLLGFSGGGAAAIYVSADNPKVYGLAVAGTPADFTIFDGDPDELVADFRQRGLFRDPEFPPNIETWLKGFEQIEPLRWIGQFKGQYLLVVHGDADELIPVEHARDLFQHAPAGIGTLSIIPGGLHRLRLDPRCIEILDAWFLKILGRGK